MSNNPCQCPAVAGYEPAVYPILLLVAGEIAVAREHHLAEQRGNGHCHNKRHHKRYEIGQAKWLEHATLKAAEEEERGKGHHDDECGVYD